ncbi:MAG: DUF6477 family protein [Paracoccus sp. (in: a-proteobacteria)]|nr:DUF6477 family protein [Paracoccus sp. (in: a-proteobacteria)]
MHRQNCMIIAFPSRESLRRPRLLVRAAQAGQSGWRRERDLPRLLRNDHLPTADVALPRLRAEEARLNEARLNRAPDYDLHRHIRLLIALLAEIRAQRPRNSEPRTPRMIARLA